MYEGVREVIKDHGNVARMKGGLKRWSSEIMMEKVTDL